MSNGQKLCKKCNEAIDPKGGQWKEYSSYSVKLVKCPKCGCYNEVRTIEDKSLNVNFDDRYYR